MTKYDPNKITATMKLVVTGEFYDDEASEETLRYCIEQDLEDAGFEVDVSLLKEQETMEKRDDPIKPTLNESHSYVSDAFKCGKCGHTIRFHAKYCEDCGQAVRWSE